MAIGATQRVRIRRYAGAELLGAPHLAALVGDPAAIGGVHRESALPARCPRHLLLRVGRILLTWGRTCGLPLLECGDCPA